MNSLSIVPQALRSRICYFLTLFFTSFVLPVQCSGLVFGPGLFDSDEVLLITLKGDLQGLLNDRTGEPQIFPVDLLCMDAYRRILTFPVEMKTRGHFRRMKENCKYPPLLIQFKDKSVLKQTVFKDQKKLKLVMPCGGDEYVVREWMVYKLYNLVTTNSFKARLVKIRLEDKEDKKPPQPFYGMLLEDDDDMAKRNQLISIEKKLQPLQTQIKPFLIAAVFEYLIGNTDWSVQYMQNIKLLAADAQAIPVIVPYDFDHAGIVQAPYAHPAPELQLSSTRERRYRGYCLPVLSTFNEILPIYQTLKPSIYNLYSSSTLLDEKYIKSTLKYFDEFYATIDNPKRWQQEFSYPCDKEGTGNVIIKGLKKD